MEPLTNMKVRLESGVVVVRYRIIGTSMVIHKAYEPTVLSGLNWEEGKPAHSSLTSFDEYRHEHGVFYGEVGSRRLTPELDSLPAMTQERSEAVKAYHRTNYARAFDSILAAFPDARHGVWRDGEIVITDPLPPRER